MSRPPLLPGKGVFTRVSHGLLVAWLATASLLAGAQADWRRVAVPYYPNAVFVQSLYRHAYVPWAQAFVDQARTQADIAQAYCTAGGSLDAARAHWRSTMLAWEHLTAASVGPLLQRRSARRIDFSPVRPDAVQRAIAAAPAAPADLERIGAPAKGLPALEWLWWTQPAQPGTPACTYAVLLAQEVAGEADALLAAFTAAAPPGGDEDTGSDEAAAGLLAEAVNQWIGGVENLRWSQIDKPRHAGRANALPRAASGSTAQAWQARWSALRTLAVLDGPVAPAVGAGLVPLETLLRSHGLNAPADRLHRAVGRADTAVQRARPDQASTLDAAVAALAALKQQADRDTAPALHISASFSDADGD